MITVRRSRTICLIYVIGYLLDDYRMVSFFRSRRVLGYVPRTIDGRRYVIIGALNLVTDNLNLVTDNGHSIVDAKCDIRNSPHSSSVIDSMHGLQALRGSHLSLLLSQIV